MAEGLYVAADHPNLPPHCQSQNDTDIAEQWIYMHLPNDCRSFLFRLCYDINIIANVFTRFFWEK